LAIRSDISAVIIAHNEAHQIQACLERLKLLVNEIIVIDHESSDKTKQICEDLGAKVVTRKWEGYAKGKNFGNNLATNDWIISIDADEHLSEELIVTIQNLNFEKDKIYQLDRANYYCGQWIKYCGWNPDWKLRLFNKHTARWKGDFVHEELIFEKQLTRKKLSGKLLHYSYASAEDHLTRIDKYAKLTAQELHQKGKTVSFFNFSLSPLLRFVKTYVLKLGFLDGKNGLEIARHDRKMTALKYQYLQELNAKNS